MSLCVADSISSRIRLNDGVMMPMFGLGTNGCEKDLILHALRSGYRLIDSAQMYENDVDVGEAVRESDLPRDDVFITSKVWMTNNGYETTRSAIQHSLDRQNLGYIDLYMVHSPHGGKVLETYDAILEYQEQGHIRSVGVSNFGIEQLEGLKSCGRPLPSVNQIELHPFFHQQELVNYCRDNQITVMGFCPLAKMSKLSDPTMVELSKKYGKTVAQVMLRWSVQLGYITIPKSSNKTRVTENTDVFDWSLTEEDMQKMTSLPETICAWKGWLPGKSPWLP